MKRLYFSALLCAALLQAAPAAGQNRRALIEQARSEFADSVRMRLLMSAMNPELGPPDSLMAVAGYDLAASLIRTQQHELAATWLRWLARHAARWPLDRNWYPPSTANAYDQAVTSARSNSDTVRTSWRWPARFATNAQGSIQATTADGSAAFSVSVAGRAGGAASAVTLPPGTYSLIVSAEGYESAQITRDVLPGVAAVLQLELAPNLPIAAQSAVSAKLVRIGYTDASQQACQNGVLAGTDGLVLTTLTALRGKTGLQVSAFDGPEVFRDVPVIATDEARNLAVLKLNTQRAQPIAPATLVNSAQYAWAVHFAGCGNVTTTRTRIGDWPASPVATVALSTSVGANAAGAALVDRAGQLIGLISSSNDVLPFALAQDVLARARRPIVVAEPPPPVQLQGPRRKFPWMWAGAGVAAAGLGVALLGGGGGSNGPGPSRPTTGGIIITIPN